MNCCTKCGTPWDQHTSACPTPVTRTVIAQAMPSPTDDLIRRARDLVDEVSREHWIHHEENVPAEPVCACGFLYPCDAARLKESAIQLATELERLQADLRAKCEAAWKAGYNSRFGVDPVGDVEHDWMQADLSEILK